jgi:hypothetical protein
MITYKGYYIKNHNSFPSNFIIVTEGQGGRIPDKMKGMFTSAEVAKNLIDTYLERKANASKTRTKSRD